MVAIFTGAGTGFERGSWSLLGSQGLWGASAQGRSGEGVFVNAANGNLLISRQDEFLAGLGPDLAIARTYNSVANGANAADDNNDQWRQSTDRRLIVSGTANAAGSSVRRVSGDGTEIVYAWNGSLYTTTEGAGAHDSIAFAAGVWTWTDGATQLKETYEAATTIANGWRLKTVRDPDSNTITLSYTSTDRLKTIATATTGGVSELIEYEWGASDLENRVTKVTVKYDHDFSAATALIARSRTTYAYDASNRLEWVTVDETPDIAGDSATAETIHKTKYEYDGSTKRVSRIWHTDGATTATIADLVIKYDPSGRVEWLVQTAASGDTRVTKVEYFANQADVKVYQKQFNPFVDAPATWPNFLKTSFYYDASGQLTRLVAPPAYTGAAAQEANFTYDASGNVVTVAQGVTNVGPTTTYLYDANGNVTQITDPNGNVTTRAYNSLNKLTLETRTGVTANASSPQVPLYTRYIYDGGNEGHLRYVISHEQRVTEYKYTTAGLLEYTIEYPQQTYATLVAPTLPTEAQMDAWRNGLDRSTAKITKFVYDARGNLFDKFSYGAASSAGVESTSEGARHDHFVYDQHGRMLSRYTETQQTETFVYDGLNRLVASTDLNGGATTIAFADGATTTTVTIASGFTTLSTYNKAGDLLTRVDSGTDTYTANSTTAGAPTIQHQYDKNGRVRVTTLAAAKDGALRYDKTYFLYDKAGKKIGEIGAGGQLTRYQYDEATGRLIATTRHQTVLTAAQLTKLADPNSELQFIAANSASEGANELKLPPAHIYDIWQWTIYDAAGRVTATILGDGSVTTYSYDQSDRLVATTGYYNKLAVSGFMTTPPMTLSTLPTADTARDRITRTFYDGDGRVIGALDSEGYLSEIIYDKAGQKVQEIAYAALTVQANRASGTFATLKGIANPANDITTRYVYDGQGLLRYTIDALNRVTETVYWEGAGSENYATGLVRKAIAYAAPLGTVADYKYATIKSAVAALAASANDRASYNVYNDRGQLAYSLDPAGAVTAFVYDNLGRVAKTTQFATLHSSALGAVANWKSTLDTWAATNSTGARITRNYYAARGGDLLYAIDAEGYVTGFVYEAQGRVYSKVRYENKLAPNDTWTTATVAAAGKGGTIWTLFRYDTFGRLQDVYDGNNVRRTIFYYNTGEKAWEIEAYAQGMDEKRTLFVYDQSGKLKQEIRYTSEADNTGYLGTTATQINQAQRITSPNGQYIAMVTREGELRVYHNGFVIWSNGVRDTTANATFRLVAQTDGNLVLFRDVSGQASVVIWQSNTAGSYAGPAFLTMQNDGNFAFAKGTAPTSLGTIWATNTAGVTAPAGAAASYTTSYTYDGLGNRLTTTNENGDVTTYTYDKVGHLKSETNPLHGQVVNGQTVNGQTFYEYDGLGRGVKITNPVGGAAFNFYDKLGRVIQSVDAQGYVTETAYTVFGEVASTTRRANIASNLASVSVTTSATYTGDAARDRVTSFAYDKLGRVISKSELLLLSPSTQLTTTYTYDSFSNLVKTVDASGGATWYYYDLLGRSKLIVDSENYVTESTLDAHGNVTTQKRYYNRLAAAPTSTTAPPALPTTHALDQSTSYTYDLVGRVLTKTDALNGLTQFQYDRRGNLVKTIDALNAASYFYYDKFDRVVLAVDAEGYAAATTYKPSGEVATRTRYANKATNIGDVGKAPTLAPDGAKDQTSTYAYDKLGRLVTETDALGSATQYQYDAVGNVVKIIDPLSGASFAYYDKLGRLTLSVDAELYIVTSVYDALGNVTQQNRYYNRLAAAPANTTTPPALPTAHALDQTTTYAYDKLGRLVTETDALGSATQYQYDAVGNVTQKNEAGLRTTTYQYDKLGRLTRNRHDALYEVSGATIAVPTSTSTPAEDFVYDANGNLIQKTDATGAKTLYWYDKIGRRTHEVSPSATLSVHSYDSNSNRTQTVVYATALGAPPTNATGPAPTQSGSARTMVFEYDKLGRQTKTKTLNATVLKYDAATSQFTVSASTTTLETQNQYDALGNVVLITDAKGAKTYSYYDKLGRKLAQVDAANYRTDWSYDALGNALSERRYAVAAAAPTGTASPPAVTTNADDRITNFAYDKLGHRLTETRESVKVHDGAGNHVATSAVIAYEYNALGAVARKIEASGDAINYAYDKIGRMTSETRGRMVSGAFAAAYTDQDNVAVNPRVEYDYNALGDLTQTRAVGNASTPNRITDYTYGAGGRLATMKQWVLGTTHAVTHTYRYDKAGRVTRDEYNRANLVSQTATEAIGYDYDSEGRVIRQGVMTLSGGVWSRKGPAIDTVAMSYNAFGEIALRGFAHYDSSTGAETTAYVERFDYDDAGRLWRTTSGDGTWKYFGYDEAGNQTLAIQSVGADIANKALTGAGSATSYWANNAAIWSGAPTTENTVVATITRYDARNQAIEVREPQRRLSATVALADLSTSRGYTAFGEIAFEINANNARIDYSYNTMGRLIKTESPAVSVTSETGVVTNNVRPVEHRYYDASGRLVASRDANGNLTKLTLLAGTGYGGSQALVAATTTADNAIVTTLYDALGQARKVTDQLGRVTLNAYDLLGRLTQVSHPGGLVDNYEYDGMGQRTKHWNSFLGAGNAETMAYDAQGRLTQVTAFGGDVTTYAYAWDASLSTNGMGDFDGWSKTTTYANFKTLTEKTDAFGRDVGKTDLGNNVTSFTYDKAGRLVIRAGGIALTQAYFNTGRLASTQFTVYTLVVGDEDNQTNSDTRTTVFGYDKLGAVTSEKLTHAGDTWTWTPAYQPPGDPHPEPGYWEVQTFNRVYKNATAQYDALGRITSWNEQGAAVASDMPAASHVFQYDANGNIRRSLGTYRALDPFGTPAAGATTQDYWYKYDALNRMTIAKGSLSAGQIVRGSTGANIYYRADGSRFYTINAQSRREDYGYDAAGRVIEVRNGTNHNAPGAVLGTFGYDLMGRLTSQVDINGYNGFVSYTRTASYNAKGQLISDDVSVLRDDDVYRTLSTYSYGTGATYALGQVTQIDALNWKDGNVWPTNQTINTYAWRDGPVLDLTTFNGTWTTDYKHDIIGGQAQLARAVIADGRPRTVSFVNDFLGQGIKRDEQDGLAGGDPHEIWYRFSGRQQAYVGNNGTIDIDYMNSVPQKQVGGPAAGSYADFDLAYDPINAWEQGSRGGTYTVQAGDTLSGIAAALWGDANLWYKIAEVNGLTAESQLIEGMPLLIPVGVVRTSNTAETFKPYDPLEVLGNVSPTSPSPKKNKCGAMGQILIAVIAVVVAVIVTAGAAAAMSGQAFGSVLSATLNGTLVAGSAAGSVGLSTAIAAGAIGGAAGSIVSQGIGVATGIQDKFSWNAVGLAAIGGAIGAGGGKLGVGGNSWHAAALRGMVASTITQGIGVATGMQKEFSWAGVAAAGVGATLGYQAANHWIGESASLFTKKFAASSASMIGNAATRSLIEGTDFGDNVMAALPDVIGQTIGEAIAGGIQRVAANRARDRALEAVAERARQSGIWEHDWQLEQFAGPGAVAAGDTIFIPGQQAEPSPSLGEMLSGLKDVDLGRLALRGASAAGAFVWGLTEDFGGSDPIITPVGDGSSLRIFAQPGDLGHVEAQILGEWVPLAVSYEADGQGGFTFPREALVNEFGTALITAMSGPNDEWRRMQGAPPPIGHNGGPAPDPDPVGTSITLFATAVAVNESQRPRLAQWLRDLFDAGNQFNRDMRANYQYNEVEVRNANGRIGRVDSYNPGREIVERKFTQLSGVQEATARGYINQLANNYPPGSTITNSRFNASLLRGTQLTGGLVLEVPVQRAPVPRSVLEHAARNDVIIRDSQGRVYR